MRLDQIVKKQGGISQTDVVAAANNNMTSERKQLVENILNRVSASVAQEVAQNGVTPEIQKKINQRIEDEVARAGLTNEEAMVVRQLAIQSTGYGPIEPLLNDPTVTEIIVQRYDRIMIERGGKMQLYNAKFNSEQHLQIVINKIVQTVGRQINVSFPICDARLLDGSRVNAVIPPITPDGATLDIRKFSDKKLTGEDYLNFKSLTQEMLDFLQTCVKGRTTIFITGGTGTGKTTFLNMLSNAIPKDEQIVTIEDTCELRIQSDNVRRMETRTIQSAQMEYVDTARCVKNALRMRPDRIIVGEIRDGSIVDFLSAASTGHEGSLATAHANSARNMCNVRLPILYSANKDMEISEASQMLQFYEAVHMIAHLKRFKDGARRIVEISELSGVDENTGKIILNPIFIYDEHEKRFRATGYVPDRILDILDMNQIVIDKEIFRVDDKTTKVAEDSTEE